MIAGNHDLTLDPSMDVRKAGYTRETAPKPEELKDILKKSKKHIVQYVTCAKIKYMQIKHMFLDCTFLEDESVTLCDLNFYGSPWCPKFGFTDWGFYLPRDSEELRMHWADVPDDTDVLMTHTPPLGVMDACWRGDMVGCKHLLEEVVGRIKPRLHVFGHIHGGDISQS